MEAASFEGEALSRARRQVEAELADDRGALRGERVALEAERMRVMEMRQVATADLAAARAKEDRLRR